MASTAASAKKRGTKAGSRAARAEHEPRRVPLSQAGSSGDDEAMVTWSIRMPAALARRIKDRADVLTREGGGAWSGNRLIVKTLEAAAESWGK